MRALILIAGAALSLAACGSNGQAGNTVNADENLFAENMMSNDVTAIDAVTGADANMAADVNFIDVTDNNVSGGSASSTGAPAAKAASGNTAATVRSAPKPAPTENTTANTTANNAL